MPTFHITIWESGSTEPASTITVHSTTDFADYMLEHLGGTQEVTSVVKLADGVLSGKGIGKNGKHFSYKEITEQNGLGCYLA